MNGWANLPANGPTIELEIMAIVILMPTSKYHRVSKSLNFPLSMGKSSSSYPLFLVPVEKSANRSKHPMLRNCMTNILLNCARVISA